MAVFTGAFEDHPIRLLTLFFQSFKGNAFFLPSQLVSGQHTS